MIPGREFESAITVRLGILGAGVHGGFAGYWSRLLDRYHEQADGGRGAGLAGPSRRRRRAGHGVGRTDVAGPEARGAGVIAGSVLTIAAVVALLVRSVWQ